MSGGSGGGGTTNIARFEPPEYSLRGWQDYVNNATAVTQTPYQQYQGMQVAPINNTQSQYMQSIANLAGNNAPDYAAARAQNQLTAMGAYEDPTMGVQTEVGYNPWFGAATPDPEINRYRDAYMGGADGSGIQKNRFEDKSIALRPNDFTGFSPAYADFKSRGLDDIVKKYQTGVAAQTDSAYNRGVGSYQSGAHQAQIGANQYGLGQALAGASTQMDMEQWKNSGALDDAALNRDLQAQSSDFSRMAGINENYLNRLQSQWNTDTSRNAGLEENAINRVLQNQNQYLDRNSNLATTAQQLGIQAQQGDFNRMSNAWNNERNRQVGSLGGAIQGQQSDLNSARAGLSIGDMQRQYTQDMLNQQYNNFNQYQQFPYQMLDAYGAMLSRASGNYGQNTSQSTQNYQASPFANLLGAGLLGAGAYNAWGG